MVALTAKVDRHEKWIQQIPKRSEGWEMNEVHRAADKLGIKLEH